MNNDNLIIVFGPSCVGKTTVVKTLSKLHPSCITYDYDDILLRNTLKLLSTQGSFIKLRNIFGLAILHALYYGLSSQILEPLLTHISPVKDLEKELMNLSCFLNEHKKGIAVKSISEIVESTIYSHKRNERIIIDLGCGIESLATLSEMNPYLIMLYTPFSKIFNRIISRNDAALSKGPLHENFLNWRSPLPVYRHFSEFFCSQDGRCKEKPLEILNKKTIKYYVHKIYQIYPHYLPRDFQGIELFEKRLLDNFGFINDEPVKLYTKYKHHHILNTSHITSPHILQSLNELEFN